MKIKVSFYVLSSLVLLSSSCSPPCTNSVYSDHPILGGPHSNEGCLRATHTTARPIIKNNRFYMKNGSFSIGLPEEYRDALINEDGYEMSSIAILSKHSGETAVIMTEQTRIFAISSAQALKKAKEHFQTEDLKILMECIPDSTLLYETDWSNRNLAAYLAIFRVPRGCTFYDQPEPEFADVVRAYLAGYIEGAYVTVVISDLDRKNESPELYADLLNRAVAILESYENERYLDWHIMSEH